MSYFDNVLKTINQQQFLNILKLYEIIIKEMMNINKTKVIQYLLDFMIIRKNMDLDMLNYNYKTNYAMSIQMDEEPQNQIPDSTNSINVQTMEPSADDSFQYLNQNLCNIQRTNIVWQTAKSQFFTSVKSLCKTRMSSTEQLKRYEKRSFDNNHRGRQRVLKAIGVTVEDGAELNNNKTVLQKRQQHSNQVKNQHLQAALSRPPLQQQQLQMPPMQRQQSPMLIVIDSPPQTSPSYHQNKIPPQIQVVPQQEIQVQRPILVHREPLLGPIRTIPKRRNSTKATVDKPAETTVAKPPRKPPARRQTIHERQVVIPNEQPALNITPINSEVQNKNVNKITRRQSCHERAQMNSIEKNYVSFLKEYESKVAENSFREQLRTEEKNKRHREEQEKINDEKRCFLNRPADKRKKTVRFSGDELPNHQEHQKVMITNQSNHINGINNQPENLQRIFQVPPNSEQIEIQQRQLRFDRMQRDQYNAQQQQQQQQQNHHIRDRSPIISTELILRDHHPERHHPERHHPERQHPERHHSERHHSERQFVAPTVHYVQENMHHSYERALHQDQINQQQNHREIIEDGSPILVLHNHQQYVEQMKNMQQFNGRHHLHLHQHQHQQQQQQQQQQQHIIPKVSQMSLQQQQQQPQQRHQQPQAIQVRLSGPSRDKHQDRSPETLYYSQEIRQSPQTYQTTSSSSTSSGQRMVSPQWQLPSREQSPIEYEHHDQQPNKLSLQRKTIMKIKNNTKYVEPNQNHNPFYHNNPQTYYSNPYVFTRPQPNLLEPITIHKNQNAFECPQNNSIPQLQQNIVHQISHPPTQFPYYGLHKTLPPVPPFKGVVKHLVDTTEPDVPIHRVGYPEPPTDFLRDFYKRNCY